jgi:glycosyltransferase involved in cell wall biosynthesis
MAEARDNHSTQFFDRKLRIAMLGSRGIPHTYSGYEQFLGEVGPRLAARGHEVIVYCRRSLFEDRPKQYKGVQLIYLPGIETKTMGTLTHTLVSVGDVLFRNVDVIFVVNVVNAFNCILPRLLGKNVAINVDGLDWKRGKWGFLGKRFFYWNAKYVGRICPKGVITDAQEMRRIYLDEFDTPTVSIAYGANVEKSSNPAVLEQYGLQPSGYYLVASRLVPENNAALIVQAFEKVKSSRELVIAGSANYRSAFVDKLKQTKDPRVKFLGHVRNADHVKELHCNAYAYLHGHSLGGTNPALLKALGYGNCVLALGTPFNREVLQDYGMFFENDPADLSNKMQLIENHPEIAARFRLRAPERIQKRYTWEMITDQYEELFIQLANGQDPTKEHSTIKHPCSQPERHEAVVSSMAANQ